MYFYAYAFSIRCMARAALIRSEIFSYTTTRGHFVWCIFINFRLGFSRALLATRVGYRTWRMKPDDNYEPNKYTPPSSKIPITPKPIYTNPRIISRSPSFCPLPLLCYLFSLAYSPSTDRVIRDSFRNASGNILSSDAANGTDTSYF